MKSKKTEPHKFSKAQTPEMIKKQRRAIITYYTKKRKDERTKKH